VIRETYKTVHSSMNSLIKSVYRSIGSGIFGFVAYCFCFWYLYYINNKDILLAACATLSALLILLSVMLIGISLFGYYVLNQMMQLVQIIFDEQGEEYKELQKELQKDFPLNNLYIWFYANSTLCNFFGSVISVIAILGIIAVPILVYK